MKIYVACPFADRDRAAALAEQLRAFGHDIAYEWWKTAPEHGGKPAEAYTPDELRQIGQEEVRAVTTSDLVVSIFPRPSIGNLMECGMAIASGTPLVVLADLEAWGSWRLVPFAHLTSVLVSSSTDFARLPLEAWDGTAVGWRALLRQISAFPPTEEGAVA